MSGYGTNTVEGGNQFTEIILTGQLGSPLTNILMADAIIPGSSPSYELCKLIYAYHPLGAKMAEKPVDLAQSQERELAISAPGEERLLEAFRREWLALGEGIGADALIKNVKTQSRVYGIASLAVGDRNRPDATGEALDWWGLPGASPYFSTFDPLNTAGSLILDQNPNSPDFQKPTAVRVGSRVYHPSRTVVVMNEAPLYIQWSDSAFGFSGRSIYQRAVFQLKTFLQSMITDDMVTKKVGLLIYKAKAPGSIQNNRVLSFFGWKRSVLKGGMTGNVLNIGTEEEIESLNFQNLEGPAKLARENVLKNIASAAGMPAKLLEEEEMIGGMAEGTEDAKQIARHLARLRIEMNPIYAWFDRFVQHRAWSQPFFESLQRDYPEYRSVDYRAAFYQWTRAFSAKWPNLLEEPESQKVQTEKVRFEAVVAIGEVMLPEVKTQDNKAAILAWMADEVNSRRQLFTAPLYIDEQAEADYVAPVPDMEDGLKEPKVEPFSPRT